MGLDSVELVMAWEEEFGIRITDSEAEKMETVGAAIDLILGKLHQCISTSAREIVADAISQVTGRDGCGIGPETLLSELLPAKLRREQWNRLRDALDDPPISGLRRPTGVVLGGWLFVLAVAALFLPNCFFAAIAAAVAGFSFFGATRRFRLTFPRRLERVGDLIARIECKQEKFRQNQWLSRDVVSEQVIQIIVEQLGVDSKYCTEDARFIADLGCG